MKLRSLKLLEMEKCHDILNTKEEVEELGRNLEVPLLELARAKRRSWAEAKNIVLD